MRVLVITNMYPSLGRPTSGTFVRQLVHGVASLGIRQHVVHTVPKRLVVGAIASHRAEIGKQACEPGPQSERVEVQHLPYQHIPQRISARLEVLFLNRALSSALASSIEYGRVDLIHAHYLFPTGSVAVRAGASLGVPVICTAHGSDVHTNPHRSRGIQHFTQQTIRNADQITAVSRALATEVQSLEQSPNTVRVLYNGVDQQALARQARESRLRERLGIGKNSLVVGTVGRLVAAKGIFELARAFAQLVSAGHDGMLLVAGDGPDRGALARWLEAEGLTDRVWFLGTVPHADIANVLGSMDIFCLPSHREGVPVSMLEAMACGLPVLVSDVGGIPEVVSHDATGYLVPPLRPSILEERLLQLAASSSLRERLGAAGLERIRDGFLASQAAENLVSLYEEVLANRSPGAR